ncbi:MAG: hypothetical protein RSE41_05705 [Clostridia bacterium]
MFKYKKAISFLVLIISINIIIIISGIIIMNLSKNNLIDKAKESIFKNNIKVLQEIVNMDINNKILNNLQYTKTGELSEFGIDISKKEYNKYSKDYIVKNGKVGTRNLYDITNTTNFCNNNGTRNLSISENGYLTTTMNGWEDGGGSIEFDVKPNKTYYFKFMAKAEKKLVDKKAYTWIRMLLQK